MTNFQFAQDLINKITETASIFEDCEENASVIIAHRATATRSGVRTTIEYKILFPITVPEWALPSVRFESEEDAQFISFSGPHKEVRVYFEEDFITLLQAVLTYYVSLLGVKNSLTDMYTHKPTKPLKK